MSQRIPNVIWFVTLLISVVVGIWLGFGLGQEHWNFFSVLLGWYFFFFELGVVLFGQSSSWLSQEQWYVWLLSWIYPLALLFYAVCAFWAMCCVRGVRKPLMLVVVAAVVAVLVSIPASIVTSSINQHTSLLRFFLGYTPALALHGILFIQLLISAVAGWLISVLLMRVVHIRQRLRTA